MTGALINTGAVLVGSAVGLATAKNPSARLQGTLKALLGVLVVFAGLSTTWKAMGGTGFFGFFKQLGIVLLSLVIGNAIGRGLRIQDNLNKVGEFARRMMSKSEEGSANKFSEGFVTCTLLFCVGPMAIIGSLQDGIDNNFRVLALKSVMDGLAAMAFARTFGPGVMLSALPVLAYEGTITLAAKSIQPYLLAKPGMLDALNATGGLVVVCISVVIFEIQKVPLANYLPALIVAPLLALWWGF